MSPCEFEESKLKRKWKPFLKSNRKLSDLTINKFRQEVKRFVNKYPFWDKN